MSAEFTAESNSFGISKVRCGHRTLQFAIIKAQFVGVDAHIDPRSYENSLVPVQDGNVFSSRKICSEV